MANPFFPNNWNQIRHGYNPRYQTQPQSAKPKIVNIPVHFAGDEIPSTKQSPASAAATIQRAVRGFLVRKNALVVRQVATQVEEIERKVGVEEDKIRFDNRERIVVSETLMALLLRLDSVRGVRDLRKRVVRRIIGLQEAIDSIAAADRRTENQEGLRDEGSVDSTMDDEEITDQTVHIGEEIAAAIESARRDDGTISISGIAEDPKVAKEGLIDLAEETKEVKTELEMGIPAEVESPERQSDLIMASDGLAGDEDSSIGHETETGVETPAKAESPKGKSDLISMAVESVPEGMEEGSGMRGMLERMAAENERLKGMVTQLCAASSEQCRLMKGLAERVEQLERVVNHRMDRRKKRRSSATCSALSSAK